jgi:hypothetical protein
MRHANHADQSAFDGIGHIDKMDTDFASWHEADRPMQSPHVRY